MDHLVQGRHRHHPHVRQDRRHDGGEEGPIPLVASVPVLVDQAKVSEEKYELIENKDERPRLIESRIRIHNLMQRFPRPNLRQIR